MFSFDRLVASISFSITFLSIRKEKTALPLLKVITKQGCSPLCSQVSTPVMSFDFEFFGGRDSVWPLLGEQESIS